jgi:hypothetical protein
MRRRNLLLSANAGYLFMAGFLIGWWPIAGYVPPPEPNDSAATVAAWYASHATQIRFGLWICLGAAALILPWCAAIGAMVGRIEGRNSPFAYVMVAAGAALAIEFIIPSFLWLTAAYRPESNPEITRRLNDAGWLPFLGAASTTIIQCIVIGTAILSDRRQDPIFPRWLAYFSFWAAVGLTPATLIIFFHTGPLAWHGVIAFWMVFIVFGAWAITMTFQLVRAIKRHVPAGCPPDEIADLRREMAELRTQLATRRTNQTT